MGEIEVEDSGERRLGASLFPVVSQKAVDEFLAITKVRTLEPSECILGDQEGAPLRV